MHAALRHLGHLAGGIGGAIRCLSGHLHAALTGGHLGHLTAAEGAVGGVGALHASADAIVHGAHVGDGDRGGVHIGLTARKLLLHALGAQVTEGRERLHAGLKFLIGAELGGVLLHIRGDQLPGLVDDGLDIHGVQELLEILVVQLGVFLAAEDPVDHGPVAAGDGQGRIDVVVDGAGGAVALEGAEGQIVVPGDHGKLALILVQIVIVDHGAGVAVAVDHKIVDHEVADHRFHIHGAGIRLAQGFQGRDQPGLVRVGHVGLGAGEDGGVAVRVVIDILELRLAGAHTHAAAHIALADIHIAKGGAAHDLLHQLLHGLLIQGGQDRLDIRHGNVVKIDAVEQGGIDAQLLKGAAQSLLVDGHAEAAHAAPAHFPPLAHALAGGGGVLALGDRLPILLCGVGHGGDCGIGGLGAVGGGGELLKIEILAVAPAAAHVHAVGLVQVAVVAAVIALEEALLHRLHRQVQSPVLTVDGDVDIAAQGGSRAEFVHHLIDQVVLHHGIILDQIVQAQLVQTVIALGGIVLVELDLQAVPVGVHGGHGGQRRVALAPDAHIFEGLAVDDHAAQGVFLALCGLQEGVPVVDDDIDGVHLRVVEQPVLIAHGPGLGLDPESRSIHEQDGAQQRDHHRDDADPVYMLACAHGVNPCNRRCS